MKKSRYTSILLLMIAFILPVAAGAQTEALRKKHFNVSSSNVAIQGYDPVCYLLYNKASKGNSSISYTYKGVVYYFTSSFNMDLFKNNPEKYEPAYGGWCAYAMGAKGEKVEIDPATFKVVNGKVYLFYNFYFNNTLTTWNKDEANLKTKADRNWSVIFK